MASHLCSVIVLLCAHSLALLRPREVDDRHDEEAVPGIRNTSKSIVPCQPCCKHTESATSTGKANGRLAVTEAEIGQTEHEEGEIQCEEQEEEGHGRLERTEEEEEGEDEPALGEPLACDAILDVIFKSLPSSKSPRNL